jgi:hypothetical protein
MGVEVGSRKRWLTWIAGVILVASLVGIVFSLISKTPPIADTRPRIVTFPDGSFMEIYGIYGESHTIEVGDVGAFSLGSVGQTHAGIGSDDVSIQTTTKGGKVQNVTIQSNGPRLILDIRRPGMTRSNYRFSREMVAAHPSNRSARPPYFEPKSNEVLDVASAMDNSGIGMVIQLREQGTGWVSLTGPFPFWEGRPDRCLMVLPAWKRDEANIEFRAILPMGETVEFTLPNPGFRASPGILISSRVPWSHLDKDYSLTATQVERFGKLGSHPLSCVDLQFEPAAGVQGVQMMLRGASDEWGNTVDFGPDTHDGKTKFAAYLPTSSRKMAIRFDVERVSDYQRPDAGGLPIMEGVVSTDGKTVDFSSMPETHRFGVSTLPKGSIRVLPAVHPYQDGWSEMNVEMTCLLRNEALPYLTGRLGEVEQWQYLVFPDSETQSAGTYGSSTWSRSGSKDGLTNKRSLQWRVPSPMLAPGKRFRIVVMPPIVPEEFTLTLELPSAIQGP